jgi:hypothetical protein
VGWVDGLRKLQAGRISVRLFDSWSFFWEFIGIMGTGHLEGVSCATRCYCSLRKG